MNPADVIEDRRILQMWQKTVTFSTINYLFRQTILSASLVWTWLLAYE